MPEESPAAEDPQPEIPEETAPELPVVIPAPELPQEDVPEELPQPGIPEEEPQPEVPLVIPVEVPQEAPAEIPQEAPAEIPQTDIPGEIPEEAPQTDIPEDLPLEAPAEIPQDIPEEAPQTDIPEEIPQEAPADIPEESPQPEAPAAAGEPGVLETPQVGEEIQADEQAVVSAGLRRPGEAELDQIILETQILSQDAPAPEPPEAAPDTENEEPMKEPKKQRKKNKLAKAEAPTGPKGRPKRKKGYGLLGIPHILVTLVWLAITAFIGVSLGRMLWICAAEVLAFGNPDQAVTITISDSDNIDTIANKLKKAGLIQNIDLFKMYADLTDAEEEISPGTFTLNKKFDYHALVNGMSYHSPARETVEVVIPEGYTCAQIFQLLEEKGVCTAAKLEEYAANGHLEERWFLEGITRGDKYCLEGYLFPDTYEFYTNDTPGRVLGKFLNNFDNRFTDLMKSKIDPLNERLAQVLASRGYDEEFIASRKITIREIVIIASMIEKESANDAENYDVSSVIYNRLTNPKNYPFLNIDATLIYALGGNIDPETGKTKPLTKEDLLIEHPYNTYTVKGLIPGPISNPGRSSLDAALDPSETNYYWYVLNPQTNTHLFAETESGHQKNKDYVNSLRQG